MVGVVVTALALYNLTGRVTPFHVAAVVAGGSVLMGLGTVLGRRPRKDWIRVHAVWMSWSYIGLLAALVAETSTRYVLPFVADSLERSALWPAFWTVVAVASIATLGVGAWLVRTRLPSAIANARLAELH